MQKGDCLSKYLVILYFLFGLLSCQTDNNSWVIVETYPNGARRAEQHLDKTNGRIFRRDYFKNGYLKKEYSVLENEIDGVYKEYYNNGVLRTKVTLKNGKRIGEQRDYFPSGKIETVSNFENGKIQGFQYFYDEDGNIRTLFYNKDDKILYEKRQKGLPSKGIELGYENYTPIIYFKPDSIKIGIEVVIRFELPLPAHEFDLDSMSIKFTMLNDTVSHSKTLIAEEWLEEARMDHGSGEFWLLIEEPGWHKLVGFVSQIKNGKKKDYDFFSKVFFVYN